MWLEIFWSLLISLKLFVAIFFKLWENCYSHWGHSEACGLDHDILIVFEIALGPYGFFLKVIWLLLSRLELCGLFVVLLRIFGSLMGSCDVWEL